MIISGPCVHDDSMELILLGGIVVNMEGWCY